MQRFCGSCGTPLDDAALAARWCPACGARITSGGDAVAEGPDEPTLHQQIEPDPGCLAPESGSAIPPGPGARSPLPAAIPTRVLRATPSRWVVGALALAVVLALLSELLLALATHGNLQVIVGPYDFAHSGASTGRPQASSPSGGASGATGTTATSQTPGGSATPSPATSTTPGATPSTTPTGTPTITVTATEAGVLSVSPNYVQFSVCLPVTTKTTVTLSDTGGTSLNWGAATAAGYNISPPSGTLATGGSIPVTVSNIVQSGFVTFTAPGAQGSPPEVRIKCGL
jgi:hypothetical protein